MTGPLVFNLQRFCIHDGPGIRTTVFFKGCPLSCQWCHNPEGIPFGQEQAQAGGNELGGIASLPFPYHGADTWLPGPGGGQVCDRDSGAVIGSYMAPAALARLLMRDVQFYDVSGGGVTLSGGEPLAQDPDYLLQLLKRLKERAIHICVDSSGHVPQDTIQRLLPYVDLFMMDFKALDSQLHQRLTGHGNEQILRNLQYLSGCGARLWLRVPVVPGGNLADLPAMLAWAREHLRMEQVNLLPYHKEGSHKWQAGLNRPLADSFSVPDEALMNQLKQAWTQALRIPIKLGG